MRRRIVTMILSVSLSLFMGTSITAKEAIIGVFIHAPHVYKTEETGNVYGPGIDYITEIVRAMGYEPVVRLLPLPRILAFLKSGDIDLSLEFAKTAERAEYLYYPDAPSYIMVPSLTFLSSSTVTEIKTIDDLKGTRIGYLKGASVAAFFKGNSAVVFENVTGENWIQQNLGKLLAGRIDAAMDNNAYSYLEEARRQGLESKIKTLRIPGEGTGFYVVFSKASPKGRELLSQFNRVTATGLYDEQAMIEKYIHK